MGMILCQYFRQLKFSQTGHFLAQKKLSCRFVFNQRIILKFVPTSPLFTSNSQSLQIILTLSFHDFCK